MFYSEMLRIETGIIVPYEERAQTLPFYNNTGKFNLEYLRKLDCLITANGGISTPEWK